MRVVVTKTGVWDGPAGLKVLEILDGVLVGGEIPGAGGVGPVGIFPIWLEKDALGGIDDDISGGTTTKGDELDKAGGTEVTPGGADVMLALVGT